ncbi:MAG: radical SAM protein [Cyanobacteriota bacterium]|nr:radical SAM protein [Cyanobacteriota bacterium]
MVTQSATTFNSVYGPVDSWRYGRSLGIDPIGSISACSFNCVYCQLGEIEHKTRDRRVFIPTEQIIQDLQPFAPWDVDVITLSGSGEPTLALNLGEILASIQELTHKSVVVLTNGTLLADLSVRQVLAIADRVSVKLDAVSPEQLRRVNRPVAGMTLEGLYAGLQQFRTEFSGELALQTMMLSPWDESTRAEYIRSLQVLRPNEIQLNTPTRPKPLQHELEARGNHSRSAERPYPTRTLRGVRADVLQAFAAEIQAATGIPARCPPVL